MIVQTAQAQLEFTTGSRLADSMYVLLHIKNISDEDLCTSLDTNDRDLQDIARAVIKRDFQRAYGSWARHWSAPGRPEYISRSPNMLIDTETLMEYDDYRMVVGEHRAEKDSVLARADKILQNNILVWGDTFVDFGAEVDFNKEIGRSGKYGFHYWLWARPLNSAYLLTGEQRYLQKFDQLFNRWYDQRNRITRTIPDFDPVYYELGLGVRNRVFLEYYRLPFLTRTTLTHQRMLKTMLGAGRWLYELEKWEGYRPGNWQIHGAFMLVQIALTFPEFRESAEWLKMGFYRLDEHLANDFFDDGGHSERCPRNYSLATYLAYRNLFYLLQAHQSHPEVADTILRTMGKTLDWWITMITPTGELPAINDSHRGLFPASVFQDGETMFKRPHR